MPGRKRAAHVAFYADEGVEEPVGEDAIMLFFSKSKDRGELRCELGGLNWRRVLSNFHDSAITLDGSVYPTAEHAYHAAKYRCSSKPDLAVMFALPGADGNASGGGAAAVTNDPRAAKLAGGRRGMALRGAILDTPAWLGARERAMRTICEARWQQDAIFRRVLLAVKAKGWRLLHFERSGPRSFWGGFEKEGRVEGRNALGKILMALATREGGEARSEPDEAAGWRAGLGQ